MKRKKVNNIFIYLLSLIISLFVSWYVLDSLILALAYSILIFIFTMQLINKKKKDYIKFKNIESAYNFVNLLNVQMLSTNSIYEAYKSIENYVSLDFANIDNEDLHTTLVDISNNYNLNSFKMYINTLIIYDNNGGNFKEMVEIPTSLCQKCKVYYNKLKKNKSSKLFEISSLYLLWICVMIFVKYSLSDFYSSMMENLMYQILIFIILIVGSLFYYQSFVEYFNNKIRGMWYVYKI